MKKLNNTFVDAVATHFKHLVSTQSNEPNHIVTQLLKFKNPVPAGNYTDSELNAFIEQDPDVVLWLQDLPEQYIIKALEKSPTLFEKISIICGNTVKLTQAICDVAFSHNFESYRLIPTKFKNIEMVNRALEFQPTLIQFTPSNLLTQEIVNPIITKHPNLFHKIPAELQTEDLCIYVIGKLPTFGIATIKQEAITPMVALHAVAHYGLNLESIPQHLKTKEVVEIAIKQDGRALRFVPTEYLTSVWKLAADSLWNNDKIVFLKYIDPKYRTPEMEQYALNLTPIAISYINKPSNEMKLNALSRNGMMLANITNPTIQMCEVAFNQNPESVCYIPEATAIKILKKLNK